MAQFSAQPGFLLCPENEAYWDLLGTGRAHWEAKQINGYSFTSPLTAFGIGHRIVLDGRQFAWGFEHGEGDGWSPIIKLHPGYDADACNQFSPNEHLLLPASLPAMMNEPRRLGRVRHISSPAFFETHAIPIRTTDHLKADEPHWQALLSGESPMTIPPNTRRRVLIDLGNYYCAYPELVVSGGAETTVRIHWQESLFIDTQKWDKSQRGEIENKYFTTMWCNQDGIGDTFILDGGNHRRYEVLWWCCGRYVELLIETSHDSLIIENILFRETRYPLEMESVLSANDPRFAEFALIGWRALQMCAHETFVDCPFYEQLMYIGDTRLECLLTYSLTRDDHLSRKALRLFDYSRRESGLTQSRYPSRQTQMIPPFSLWWVAMIHDYLLWRDDFDCVRSLLPGMRSVLDAFALRRDADGLVHSPTGWNFVDWVPAWPDGIPPGGSLDEVCVPINWQYVYSLMHAAKVETVYGESEMAARWERIAQETVATLISKYWDERRGLFADDAAHSLFSEHSQCLAILSGILPEQQRGAIAKNLFTASNLTQPTVYFMHYFFETCCELNRMDKFLIRMERWFEMQTLGFKTTYENADPHGNRSDCHAWAAHPLYHFFVSVLGIRPTSPGFATVKIRPQLASLQHASGRMVHPRGEIEVDVWNKDSRLYGSVMLPEGVMGMLYVNDQSIEIHGGNSEFG
jgi:hypothetical protein